MNQERKNNDGQTVASITTENTSSNKPKNTPPDGMTLERYSRLKEWSYKKWAWEFLRRNKQFRAACKRAKLTDSDDERAKVAAEFGLKRYKPYTEKFKGESGKPLFSAGSISSWSNLDSEEDKSRRVRVLLDNGQILVRFDLASSLADAEILKKQIRLTEIRLEKRLKAYELKLKKESQFRRHKVSQFGQYLRLLDLNLAGKSQIYSGLLIAPAKAKKVESELFEHGKDNVAPAISKKMRRANEYANELYRYLAVLKGRPSAKDIPLVE